MEVRGGEVAQAATRTVSRRPVTVDVRDMVSSSIRFARPG
jgi:hypothetical protein